MYTQRHFTQPRTAVQHRITDPELAAATLARQRARLQLRALRDDPPDDPHTHHATQQATQRCQSTTSRARQLKRSRWKKSRQPLCKKSPMLGGDATLPQPGASTWREPRWPKKEEHGSACTNLFPARSSMMNEADERRPQTTLSTPRGNFGPSAVRSGGDRLSSAAWCAGQHAVGALRSWSSQPIRLRLTKHWLNWGAKFWV